MLWGHMCVSASQTLVVAATSNAAAYGGVELRFGLVGLLEDVTLLRSLAQVISHVGWRKLAAVFLDFLLASVLSGYVAHSRKQSALGAAAVL